MVNAFEKRTKLKQSGLCVGVLILSVCGLRPGYCDDMPSLRPIPVADAIETDNASKQPVETEPMQTIDEQTTKPDDKAAEQMPQTIEPKAIEPAKENKEAAPVKVIEESSPTSDAINAPAPAEKKDIGAKTAHFVSHLPQRLGLFTANMVVATPTMFVKRSAQYTASNTKELIGDHKNPILLVPAGTLSMYYALTSALVEAPTFGAINSWKHSADGKLSKESLGLESQPSH